MATIFCIPTSTECRVVKRCGQAGVVRTAVTLGFWRIWTWVFTGGALAVSVWFTVGGLFDLRYLFRHLKRYDPDPRDDGRVEPGSAAKNSG